MSHLAVCSVGLFRHSVYVLARMKEPAGAGSFYVAKDYRGGLSLNALAPICWFFGRRLSLICFAISLAATASGL